MLSGSELSRIIHEFKEQFLSGQDPDNPKNFQNHEAGGAAQKTAFQGQVRNLCDVVSRTTGTDPFLDDFSELVNLDSRDCADTSVAESVKTLDKLGKEQFQNYVKDVIKDRSRSIHNPAEEE